MKVGDVVRVLKTTCNSSGNCIHHELNGNTCVGEHGTIISVNPTRLQFVDAIRESYCGSYEGFGCLEPWVDHL